MFKVEVQDIIDYLFKLPSVTKSYAHPIILQNVYLLKEGIISLTKINHGQ